MRKVAIFGVGLIGGSFALALKKAGFSGEILGVSSDRTIVAALQRGAIDRGVTFDEAANEADLIYLASPIHRITADIQRLGKILKPESGTLVTDAGSTKLEIVAAAEKYLPIGAFLGGHPMAGKESRGVTSADANLFNGRTYVLTPTTSSQMESPSVKGFVEWVRKAGANPLVLSAEQHDHAVAFTSHLPQLASTALVLAAARNLSADGSAKTVGPGFQDMSRLALSSFDMWKDILDSNAVEIDAALESYIEVLTALRLRMKNTSAIESSFKEASDFRKRLFSATILG
jgi:prephenate dehydrogenase